MSDKAVPRDTLVDIIALGSPSGRMLERALKAAQARLAKELFPNGLQKKECLPEDEIARLLRMAGELEHLAAGGMKPRVHSKKAREYREQAQRLLEERGKTARYVCETCGREVIPVEGVTAISSRGYWWCVHCVDLWHGDVDFPSHGKLIPPTIMLTEREGS